ncbi:MAG: poly(3-hydroxyalkanoate) depolymerase [Acidimicrobiales bacterium]|jgi:poly(3-hydroxyoctanoate) depolymerase
MIHTGPIATTDAMFQPAPADDGEQMMISVGSQELSVTVHNQGCGKPLLLINGIGATGDLFEPLIEHLGDREVITFDAPGVGRSATPGYPPTMRRLARTVAGLIEQTPHTSVDVLGLSWGGALAQELAYRHPERVRRLALAATMPGWASAPGRPAAMSILMSPARYYSPSYLRRVAPTLYGGAIADHPELLDRHAEQRASNPPTARGYLYQLAALRRWSSLPWLHRLRTPTLVMSGDDDPIIPTLNAKLMAGLLPNATLHVVEGGGHLFMFTRAAETAELLQEFFASSSELARRQLAAA